MGHTLIYLIEICACSEDENDLIFLSSNFFFIETIKNIIAEIKTAAGQKNKLQFEYR